ncbi:Vacuolar sorting protein domain protein [Arachis hypogaea]|nr:Vacuolar sorting protein domain protein [Arachis hypogaea]
MHRTLKCKQLQGVRLEKYLEVLLHIVMDFCILKCDDGLRLLEMYLDPQDGKEPMFNAAIRLLHNHGESLEPLQIFNEYTIEALNLTCKEGL